MALITAQQVINLSFTHADTDTYLIKDNHIFLAEVDFIQSKLGEDLYNLIVAGSLTGKNAILYNSYILPALAYYVKWLVLPDMFANTTTSGIMTNTNEFSNSVSSSGRAELAQNTLNKAVSFIDLGVKYIEHPDNYQYFNAYRTSDQTKIYTSVKGGIVFE